MIDYDDYFDGLTEEEYIEETEKHFKDLQNIAEDIMDDSTRINVEIMTENPNMYLNLKELVERFIEIDEYYDHEPWNLQQILANIHILVPVEMKPEIHWED